MNKGTASKERDAMKEQLAAMMSSNKAPGTEQAERAVQKKEIPKAAKKKSILKKRPDSNPKRKTQPKLEKAGMPKRVGEERAEKVSVSLHPTDQDNAELIEDALRAAGLISRRAPVSFLLKVALASFDPSKVDDLEEVVNSIKSRDGRGKWMQGLVKKE